MNTLPPRLVDEIFRRFTLAWGAQKTNSAFAPADSDENITDWAEDVHNLWAAQLGAFSVQTIGRALQAAVDQGREWPPSLPEFKELCRNFNRPEHREPSELLAAPRSTPPPEARVNVEALVAAGLKQQEPLFWARFPASREAVNLLVRGAENDKRLAAILAKHLADPARATVRPGHPREAEARAALVALAKNPPRWFHVKQPTTTSAKRAPKISEECDEF